MSKGPKSNQYITKIFSREKLSKDIGLRNNNFGSEMVESCRSENSWFFGLRDSLLMGLGQDQQQHPFVHTGGGSVAVAVGVIDMKQVTPDT